MMVFKSSLCIFWVDNTCTQHKFKRCKRQIKKKKCLPSSLVSLPNSPETITVTCINKRYFETKSGTQNCFRQGLCPLLSMPCTHMLQPRQGRAIMASSCLQGHLIKTVPRQRSFPTSHQLQRVVFLFRIQMHCLQTANGWDHGPTCGIPEQWKTEQ